MNEFDNFEQQLTDMINQCEDMLDGLALFKAQIYEKCKLCYLNKNLLLKTKGGETNE